MPNDCDACQGTGEGYAGTACPVCRGLGVILGSIEVSDDDCELEPYGFNRYSIKEVNGNGK